MPKKAARRHDEKTGSRYTTPRRREPACYACIRSKKRCENGGGGVQNHPCTRCQNKGLVCRWPAPETEGVVACDSCNGRNMKCIKGDGESRKCFLCEKYGLACVYTPRAREVAAHDDTPAIEDAQLEASPSGTHDMVDPVPSLSLRVDGIDDSDSPTEHEAPSGTASSLTQSTTQARPSTLSINNDLPDRELSSRPSSAKSEWSVLMTPSSRQQGGE